MPIPNLEVDIVGRLVVDLYVGVTAAEAAGGTGGLPTSADMLTQALMGKPPVSPTVASVRCPAVKRRVQKKTQK